MSKLFFCTLFTVLLFSCAEHTQENEATKDEEKLRLLELPQVDSSQILPEKFNKKIDPSLKSFEAPNGFINDYENLFTKEESNELAELIAAHEAKSSNEIFVVTVEDITPYERVEEYTVAIGNAWNIGKDELDNGILIVLSKANAEVKLQIGEGIDEKFAAFKSQDVIFKTMMPQFQNGDFYQGVYLGIKEITNFLENEL